MYNNLELKGTTEIMGKEIVNIEGGFGKDKKSMLAHSIAKFHGKEVKHINEAVNNNVDRFINGVDVIDLKQINQLDHNSKIVVELIDHNILSKMQVAKSNNIYLFSERGYMKLVGKVFEDEKSWDIYEDIVDEYFRMRSELKKPQNTGVESGELSGESAVQVANLFKPLMEEMDIDAHSQAATYKALLEQGGVEVPLQIPAPTKDKFISMKEIANRIGIYTNSGNPHSTAVGGILDELDIDDDLIITTSGSNGKHTYSQTQYSESVISMIEEWLDKQGYPTRLDFTTRNRGCNVKYSR